MSYTPGAIQPTYPDGTSAVVLARPERNYDVRDYGAKCDTRQVLDAAITSASTTLTSATAAFTGTDVGKYVFIFGAGASGVQYSGTIASVTNSTTAVLSVAAGTTVTGKLAAIGTDDTTAVQAAMTAAMTAGGGTVYQSGVSLLASVQQTGSVANAAFGGGAYNYSGQLLISAVNFQTATRHLRIRGTAPSYQAFWGGNAMDSIPPVAPGLSGWISNAISGNVLDCIPDAVGGVGGAVKFTNTVVTIDSLIVRTPNNPQTGGLSLRKSVGTRVLGSSIGVYTKTQDIATTFTGAATLAALSLAEFGNMGISIFRESEVFGYPTGVSHSEHTVMDGVAVSNCVRGIAVDQSYHPSYYNAVKGMSCSSLIYILGACILYGTFAHENNGLVPAPGFQYDINDTTNVVTGRLGYFTFSQPQAATYNCGQLSLYNFKTDGPSSLRPNGTVATFSSAGGLGLNQADSGQIWFLGGRTWTGAGGVAKMTYASPNQCGYALMKSTNPTTPSGSIQITTSSAANRLCAGVAVKAADGSNALVIRIEKSIYQSYVVIEKYVSAQAYGGSTVLASAAYSAAVSTTYTLTWTLTSGGLLTAFINGTSVVSYQLTGAEITAVAGWNYVGLMAINAPALDDATTSWDNLSVV